MKIKLKKYLTGYGWEIEVDNITGNSPELIREINEQMLEIFKNDIPNNKLQRGNNEKAESSN